MKRFLLVLFALLFLLPLVIVVLGATAPEHHVATSRATYAAPCELVWAAVADLGSWPEWNSAFDEAERRRDEDGHPHWILTGPYGPLPSIVDVLEPPTRMRTRIPADADLGFTGTWTYELAPAEGGCALTITEDGRVRSLLFRGINRLLFDHHTTMNAFLYELGAHLGEEVEPEEL